MIPAPQTLREATRPPAAITAVVPTTAATIAGLASTIRSCLAGTEGGVKVEVLTHALTSAQRHRVERDAGPAAVTHTDRGSLGESLNEVLDEVASPWLALVPAGYLVHSQSFSHWYWKAMRTRADVVMGPWRVIGQAHPVRAVPGPDLLSRSAPVGLLRREFLHTRGIAADPTDAGSWRVIGARIFAQARVRYARHSLVSAPAALPEVAPLEFSHRLLRSGWLSASPVRRRRQLVRVWARHDLRLALAHATSSQRSESLQLLRRHLSDREIAALEAGWF